MMINEMEWMIAVEVFKINRVCCVVQLLFQTIEKKIKMNEVE